MKNENESRYTLESQIIKEIYALADLIAKDRAKLESDFVYNFEWGCAGDLYHRMLVKEHYECLLVVLREQPQSLKEYLKVQIESRTEQLLNGGFFGRSTGVFSNIAHTYKREVDCVIVAKYKLFLKWISQEEKPLEII